MEGRRQLTRLFSLVALFMFTWLLYRAWRTSHPITNKTSPKPYKALADQQRLPASRRDRISIWGSSNSADGAYTVNKQVKSSAVGLSGSKAPSRGAPKRPATRTTRPLALPKSKADHVNRAKATSAVPHAPADSDSVLYSERPAPAFFNKSYLEIYTRFPFNKRWDEARTIILPSMQLFWPHAHLVVVMDQESPDDVRAAKDMKKIVAREFPPLNARGVVIPDYNLLMNVPGYGGWQRGQLDMMFADKIVKAKYVGLADSDTFVTTLVAPNGVFTKDGRPIVIAGIGRNEQLWSQALLNVQFMLKKDYVVSCMSYFPVILATAHIREMRKYVQKIHGKSFLEVYKEMFEQRNFYCHYSTMCNYVWYFHRNEYEWHYHNFGKDRPGWDINLPGQTTNWSFLTAMNRRPIARMTVHFAHTNLHSEYDMPYGLQMEPKGNVGHIYGYQKELTEPYLVEGFCYVAAVQCRNPVECKKIRHSCSAAGFDVTKLQKLMFRFEILQSWEWDRRCIDAQKEYYETLKHYRYWLPYAKQMLKRYKSPTFDKLGL